MSTTIQDLEGVLLTTIKARFLIRDGRASITERGTPTGGTWPILVNGTPCPAEVPYNASASTLQAILAEHADVPGGAITCSGGPLPGTPILAEFGEELTGQEAWRVLSVGAGDSLSGGTNAAAEIRPQRASLSGWSLRFLAKHASTDPDASAVFTLTSASGITVEDASSGKLLVTITPADQTSLTDGEEVTLAYELVGFTGGGERYSLARGALQLKANVDQDPNA